MTRPSTASLPASWLGSVEPAKSDGLEKLGEGERALGIANTWVQTRLAPAAAVVSEPFEPQPADGRSPVRRGSLPMGHLTKGHVI